MPRPWSSNGIYCHSNVGLRQIYELSLLTIPENFADPIFFMHHAQIDRLWWTWQHTGPGTRTRNVEMFNREPSQPSISPRDPLLLNGLGMDRVVGDILSTDTTLLCYKYPTA